MEQADNLHIDSDPVDDPHEFADKRTTSSAPNQAFDNANNNNNNNNNANAGNAGKDSYASVVPFSALVDLCERSSKVVIRTCLLFAPLSSRGYPQTHPRANLLNTHTQTTKQAQKKMLLQKFFSHYHDDDYFPVMRLLLPQVGECACETKWREP